MLRPDTSQDRHDEPVAISFAQERMWFLQRLTPESPLYNIPILLWIQGSLDAGRLERGLRAVLARHEVLRTYFVDGDDGPLARVANPAPPSLALEDLSSMALPDARKECRRRAQVLAALPFDLEAAPLVRAAMYTMRPTEHAVVIVVHHIACDGESVAALLQELADACSAPVSAPPVSPPNFQYRHHAQWERDKSARGHLEGQLDYWMKRLANMPSRTDLPVDRPRATVPTGNGDTVAMRLDGTAWPALKRLCADTTLTQFMVLAAVYSALLKRCCNESDICLAVPVAHRPCEESESLIGLFVNTLILRIDCRGDESFLHLARQVRDHALDALAHCDVPFDRIVANLRKMRPPLDSPDVNVAFAYHARPPEIRWPGLRVTQEDLSSASAKFDLSLDMWEAGETLHGQFEYATDAFDRPTIERLAERFEVMLNAALKHPSTRIDDLPLLTDSERVLLASCGEAKQAFPLHLAYPVLLEQSIRQHGARMAARSREGSISHGELHAKACTLARRLLDHGLAHQGIVALLMPRGLDLLAAMWGTLIAGGAFVALDPQHPEERLRSLVQAAGASLLLVDTAHAEAGHRLVSPSCRAAVLEELASATGRGLPAEAPNPGDLAYLVFTSGSTGAPKAAANVHRGLVNHVLGLADVLGLGPDDRVAQTASVSFDVHVWQFLGAALVGGSIEVIEDEVAQDPVRLLPAVRERAVTVLEVVPSMLQHALDECPIALELPCLRWLLSTGEALPLHLALRWLERFPQVPIVNLYGPAECSDDATAFVLRTAEEARRLVHLAAVPIGKPLANVRVSVRDQALRLQPVGITGEIVIGGAGVGPGYANDAERTREAFVGDPGAAGERLYRSGDLGRVLPDGNIDFLGRRDHQMKLHGQRIEAGEIESRLCRHPSVREAAVAVHGDRLVAYVAGRNEAHVPADDLREQLAACLPRHMVPSLIENITALPRSANGKLDRAALPAPLAEPMASRQAETDAQRVLCAIWQEVLGLPDIGIDDDFFAVGGHSLLAARVVSRIRSRFSLALPLHALFKARTVAALAAMLAQAPALRADARVEPIARGKSFPLSFEQQRLWFLDRLSPHDPFYNMPIALRLEGHLDEQALERALSELVSRHEALCTRYRSIDGVPVQEVVASGGPLVAQHDLREVTDRSEQASRLVDATILRPFDLSNEAPMRSATIRTADDVHLLVITMHHIATDGWSEQVLLQELAALYAAFTRGVETPLAPARAQYADYVHWQRRRTQAGELDAHLAYWKHQLAGAPALLALPTDRPRPAVQTFRGDSVALTIPTATVRAIEGLARSESATAFMAWLAVLQTCLHRITGATDICVGTPAANRQEIEFERMVGLVVNTLVMRSRPNASKSFRTFLREVRETACEACAHQEVPFDRIVEALRPERSTGYSPLFQVMLALEEEASRTIELPGLVVESVPLHMPVAKFDLMLVLEVVGESMRASLEFNTDLFERATAERMASQFTRLAESAARHPDRCLGDLQVLSAAEERQLLVEWNDTHRPLADPATFSAMFRTRAVEFSDHIAATFDGTRITYAELDARSDALASLLRPRGAGPDVLIGLCVERSLDTVMGLLGILKSGSAFLAIDPLLPELRLAQLIDDARPLLVLTQTKVRGRLPGACPALCMDDLPPGAMLAEHPQAGQPGPDNLAYVIYTSGSTGRPKGVAVTHRGLRELVDPQMQHLTPRPGERLLQWCSPMFDTFVSEVFETLAAGATLVLVHPDEAMPGDALADTLARHEVNLLFLTPSALRALGHRPLPHLRRLLLGGEKCDAESIRPWTEHCTVFVGYGPAEATVYVCAHECAADEPADPPIGRPFQNTQLYVLDPRLNPVPVGVVGELYIAGARVARGYLGRPDLTAERFLPDPFSSESGARMYRTGDLVKYRRDGSIDYVGRNDSQVKIRGHRVELGEIEAALLGLPGVRHAAVAVHRDETAGEFIVAHVAPANAVGGEARLRTLLDARLPSYMVPALIECIEEMPLTPSGKIDRGALPRHSRRARRVGRPACTPTEQRLLSLWRELLPEAGIGCADDFFHVGGHSLLAVRLLARVETSFSIKLPLSQLLASPTIESLALAIDRARSCAGSGSLLVTLSGAQGRPPMFFMHPAGGTVFCFKPLARALADARHCIAIQSAELAGWEHPPVSWREMCELYAKLIERQCPRGPLALVGWSMGGAIALSVAALLEERGRDVERIGLFDTVLHHEEAADHDLPQFIEWARQGFPAQVGTPSTHGSSGEHGLDAGDRQFILDQYHLQATHARLFKGFVPVAVKAPLAVVRAQETRHETDWLRYTRSPHSSAVLDLPGTHENLITRADNVERIASLLAGDCQSSTGPQ